MWRARLTSANAYGVEVLYYDDADDTRIESKIYQIEQFNSRDDFISHVRGDAATKDKKDAHISSVVTYLQARIGQELIP